MKKLKIILLVILLTVTAFNAAISQYPYDFTCGNSSLLELPDVFLSDPFEGYYKPNRTDTINGAFTSSYAYFPVLIIFVQFKDDPGSDIWPNVNDTSGPIYRDSLIAITKSPNTNWWDAYDQNKETLSDFYLELSRGRFHVISPYKEAYSIVLDSTAAYYRAFHDSVRIKYLNIDIWEKLKACYPITWSDYDLWGWDDVNLHFEYDPDGNVDFIYKIHKTTGSGVLPPFSGFGSLLGSDYEVDTVNHIWVRAFGGYTSSGITCIRNQTKNEVMGVVTHEHGHFTFTGGHLTYGKMAYGVGFDAFFSPYEMIANRYIYPRTAIFGQTNTLGDYSSRNSGGGEVIKVPISDTESFLIASRRKVSHWDRVMLGDTALYDTYNNWEYGKGLYIYHAFDGIEPPSPGDHVPQDMECADGYYRWELNGEAPVYLNCGTYGPFPVFKRVEVLYDNDSSTIRTRRLKGDGLSLHWFWFVNPTTGDSACATVKHNLGKIAIDNCHLGTDRILTNTRELYSNYEHMGDRWDPWNIGYNQIFSPFSSPSTNDYDNNTSGIFIYYKTYEDRSGLASIDIYKVGSNGFDLDSILGVTPPSRPMNLKIENCDTNTMYLTLLRPKLTWNHNMEPDMIRDEGGNLVKKYRIYRSVAADTTSVPPDSYSYSENVYTLLDSVLIDTSETPSFIDTSVISICNELRDQSCPPTCWVKFPARYRIQAVDENEDRSVLSDFAYTDAYRNDPNQGQGSGGEEDGLILVQNEAPTEFALKQNFPNPFNPETNIQFDLPKDVFVKIKVYDVLGKEIATLVKEFKKAGRYIVSFNGKRLSSGIYFYKIEAGLFTDIKRMVLVK